MKTTKRSTAILSYVFAMAMVGVCSILGASEGMPDGERAAKNFGGSSPLTIPAAAFTTKGNDAESHTFIWWAGYLRGTASLGGCVQAPVYVPRWATIYQMWVSYMDNDAAQNMTVMLKRVSNWDPSDTGIMASMTSSGSSASILSGADVTIDDALVMLPDYSYYVTTCLRSENTRLISVRIWYLETVIFADGFERGDSSGWLEVP